MTEQPTNDVQAEQDRREDAVDDATPQGVTAEDSNPVDTGPSVQVEQHDGITTTSTIPQDSAPGTEDETLDPDYTETEGTKDTAP